MPDPTFDSSIQMKLFIHKNLIQMKTFTILLLSLCWLGANATIWRVNSNTQVSADFTDINEACAHWEVEAGDTLYLENGSYFGGDQTISKSLTVIGPGYFLMENDSTYAYPMPVLINSLGISANDVKVIGVSVINNTRPSGNNITIERCHLNNIDTYSGFHVQQLIVRQCFISGGINGYYNNNYGIVSSTIHNNIIFGSVGLTVAGSSHNLYNNVIYMNSTNQYYALSVVNSTVINNIVIREPVDEDPGVDRSEYAMALGNNSSFAYNVTSQPYSPEFSNNLFDETKENVFVLEGSTDKWWMLKEGSPAIGYGSNGDDCGAYGGPLYYIPSGLPMLMPRIIEAQIPSSGSGNTIQVHLKAKTQEE
jgi:hypothetical protein